MNLFVEVARTLSFSRASANLGVPPATLSRRVAAMERGFGVRLFDRTTRRVRLTDAGQRYLERCGDLVDQARIAQDALRQSVDQPVGHVKVSMPVDLGVHQLAELIPAFSRQHPGITLEFDLSPNNRDLVGEHVDVAIRIGAIKGNALIVRRIGTVGMRAFAAPAYLDQRGEPRQPGDLEQHQCVTLPATGGQVIWHLTKMGKAVTLTLRPRHTANNMGFLSALAEGGLGIAVLPTLVTRHAVQSGRLVPVLPDWAWPDMPVNAVMSSRLQPASVRAFIEFLAARLATR